MTIYMYCMKHYVLVYVCVFTSPQFYYRGVRDGYNYFFGVNSLFHSCYRCSTPLGTRYIVGSILWFCDFRHFPHPFSLNDTLKDGD